eukprot:4981976-Prymnesium_polylepis.3
MSRPAIGAPSEPTDSAARRMPNAAERSLGVRSRTAYARRGTSRRGARAAGPSRSQRERSALAAAAGIVPNRAHRAHRDAAALVRDAHAHVVLAKGHRDADRRQRRGRVEVAAGHGTHRVLEQLRHDVVHMRRHVCERGAARELDLHVRGVAQLVAAQLCRVLDGGVEHLRRTEALLDDASPPLL